MEQAVIERHRGRKRNLSLRPYTLSLEEYYAEWARTQPGGISGVLRDALRDIYNERNSRSEGQEAASS